jgi:protein gp37
MKKTDIEYLDYTWNPIAMCCRRVSIGCQNCWHLRYTERLAHCPTISTDKKMAYAGIGNFVLDQKELEAPLRLRKLSKIGVQFMGDIFHRDVTLEWINQVKNICNSKHQYFWLTKRSHNMYTFFTNRKYENIWLGVSVEDQTAANARLTDLCAIPNFKRWISVEPLLGQTDITYWLEKGLIHWVVVGVETGPGARPCKREWIISLIKQCQACYTPVFFKNAKNNTLWIGEEFRIQEYPECLKGLDKSKGS